VITQSEMVTPVMNTVDVSNQNERTLAAEKSSWRVRNKPNKGRNELIEGGII